MRAAGSSQAPQRTPGSAYDVIPMRGLATLEHPLALVAGHDLVEEALLGTSVVEVVLDDVVPERSSRHRPALERVDRLAQRVGEALGVRLVGVAFEGRWQLELVLDPVEAGCEQGREAQVRVDVAAGDARLRAEPLPVADDAEAAGPVVVPPGERRRRPASGREALVRVDRRRGENRQLLEARDLPREVLLEDVGLAGERVLAVAPEARVDVAGGPDPGG